MEKNAKMPPGWTVAEVKPQYYHEWGNEGAGQVSTFMYDTWGDYHFTGYMKKETALELGLKFHNPHS